MADPPAASPMAFAARRMDPSPRHSDAQKPVTADDVLYREILSLPEESLPDDLRSFLRQTPQKQDTLSYSYSSDSNMKPTPSAGSDNASVEKPNATYLTSRAHRFSSLKKKKGATTLLNRIFCNPASPTHNGKGEGEEVVLAADHTVFIAEDNSSDDGQQENQRPVGTPKRVDVEASCSSSLRTALQRASENLTLHDEAKVRLAIQKSLDEAIIGVCSSQTQASPPTKNVEFKDDDSADTNAATKAPKDRSIGAARKRITEAARSPSPKKSPPPPKKTPGGLVIPSAFNSASSKSLFPPNSVDRVFCRSTVGAAVAGSNTGKSPSRPRQSENRQPLTDTSHLNISTVTGPSGVDGSQMPVRALVTSFESSLESKESSSSNEDNTFPFSQSFKSPAHPNDLVRIISSREELSTVKEASSSKESSSDSISSANTNSSLVDKTNDEEDQDDVAFLPDDFKATLASSTKESFTKEEMEKCIASELAKAEQEWKKSSAENIDMKINEALAKAEIVLRKRSEEEQDRKVQQALAKIKEQEEKLLDDHDFRWKEEHEREVKELKAAFERRTAELKDQLALANRMAHGRQLEVERLEAMLHSTRRNTEVEVLRKEIELIRKEKDNEVLRVVNELEGVRSALSEREAEYEKMLVEEQQKAVDKCREVEKENASKIAQANLRESDALKRMKEAEKQAHETNSKLTEAKSKLNDLETKLVATEKNLQIANHSLLETEEKLKVANQCAQDAENKLVDAEKKLYELEKTNGSVEPSDSRTDTRLSQDYAEISMELEDTKRKLDDALQSLVEKDRLQRELEKTKEMLASKDAVDSSGALPSELKRVKNELKEAKAQLETLANHSFIEESSSSIDIQSVPSDAERELERLKEELQNVKEELEAARSMSADEQTECTSDLKSPTIGRNSVGGKEDKVEIKRLRAQIATLKNTLEVREKELNAAKKQLNTPTKQSSVIPRRSPAPSGSAKKNTLDRKCVEIYEKEKESLLQQIALLEEQAEKRSEDHKYALQQLRRTSEEEIERVKKEVEARVEQHLEKERELQQQLCEAASREKEELLEQIENLEAEKKTDRIGGLREVQKKEDLLDQICKLEKREKDLINEHQRAMVDIRAKHDIEIKELREEIEQIETLRIRRECELRQTLSETSSFEKEELLKKVEKLESDLEAERNGSYLIKMKVAGVEREAAAAVREHEKAIGELRTRTDAEIQKLRKELEENHELKQRFEEALSERNCLSKEVDSLKTALAQDRKERDLALESLRKQHAEEIKRLREDSLEKIAIEQIKLRDLAESMQGDFDKITAQLKLDYEAEIQVLKERLEKEDATEIATQEELEILRRKLRDVEDILKTEKHSYEVRVNEIQTAHAKELDDLLAQLDAVEAEHTTKLVEKDMAIQEREATLTHYADMESRLHAIQVECSKAKMEAEQLRIRHETENTELETVKAELEKLKLTHTKFLEGANAEKMKACEAAREEMIERAEAQFKQANDLYVKLKKQYDMVKVKAEKLDTELKKCKEEIVKLTREKEEQEVDMTAEIAQLKAQKAKVEADAAQKAKEYRHEMEGLLQAAKDFEKKCSDAEDTARNAQKSLALVVAEKAKMKSEYDELNKVCEELMAHVESLQQHEF